MCPLNRGRFNSIEVDTSGAAYVTGYSNSTDFPTLNPYQGTFQGGTWGDAFVTKLNSSGNSLIYSTYLGGSDSDEGYSIAVDASGAAVYVTGYTSSTDFPTLNPYQETYQGGDRDIFVTKLGGSGNSLVYSTYLGGGSDDWSMDITVDAAGEAYFTGSTGSTDFPTLNPYQVTFQGGDYDALITKLSSSGNSLVYSTYLGGGDRDEGYGIAIDTSGAAYITGFTGSTDFPTLNPYQGTFQGGDNDAYVTKLSSFGNSLIYSTYLGGGDRDEGYGIAIDTSGAAYITGMTESFDFPKFNNPYQGTFQGSGDAFVTKLSEDCCILPIRGNVDYDPGDVIDISDLVHMVDYMFNGGPQPVCWEEANVDGSGDGPPDGPEDIDISDLVHLVDYMFNGGPAPVACP